MCNSQNDAIPTVCRMYNDPYLHHVMCRLSRYIDHEAEVDEDVSDDDEAGLDDYYDR